MKRRRYISQNHASTLRWLIFNLNSVCVCSYDAWPIHTPVSARMSHAQQNTKIFSIFFYCRCRKYSIKTRSFEYLLFLSMLSHYTISNIPGFRYNSHLLVFYFFVVTSAAHFSIRTALNGLNSLNVCVCSLSLFLFLLLFKPIYNILWAICCFSYIRFHSFCQEFSVCFFFRSCIHLIPSLYSTLPHTTGWKECIVISWEFYFSWEHLRIKKNLCRHFFLTKIQRKKKKQSKISDNSSD